MELLSMEFSTHMTPTLLWLGIVMLIGQRMLMIKKSIDGGCYFLGNNMIF